MTPADLNNVTTKLSASADALAAIGAALNARATGNPLDPALQPYIDETLAALGVRDAVATVPANELIPLLARLRCYTLTNAKLMLDAPQGGHWRHTESELLEAAGDVTAGFADQLRARIAPQLEGLTERLAAPDAAFLDIGVGVAALSIGMARAWPSLRIVGIDPLPQAIALARRRVQLAGLGARIALREQSGETLVEQAAFDLVWLPSVFVPEPVISVVIERARVALKPGGWLLVPAMKQVDVETLGTSDLNSIDLTAALARLRTAMFGGTVTTTTAMEKRLSDHGLRDVRTLSSATTAVTALVVGRRQA